MPRAAAIAVLFGLLVACGGASRLIVRHDDPDHPRVEVLVDRQPVGTVEYGDALYVRLHPGRYLVDVRPEGEDENPWSDDGLGWAIFIEDEALLTLLQGARVP